MAKHMNMVGGPGFGPLAPPKSSTVAYTVTHNRCKNRHLNIEKLNDAVLAKRIAYLK